MQNYSRTVVFAGLALLFLASFGVGSFVVGVDATAHRWAAVDSGTRRHLFHTHRSNATMGYDKTRLYGPGLIIAGASLCLGALLVVPTALICDVRMGRHFWPRVVLLWKVVRAGAAVGFGMAILASLISVLGR